MHVPAHLRPWVIAAAVLGVLYYLGRQQTGVQPVLGNLVPVIPGIVAPPAIDPSMGIPPYVENAGQYGFRYGGTLGSF